MGLSSCSRWFARGAVIALLSVQPGAATAQETAGPTNSAAIEATFLQGLQSLEANRPDIAIRIFSAILAANPELVRVRLELARAYFQARQWSRARAEFFRTLSADLPEPVRKNVLRFIRQIDARRGFDWNLSVALKNLGDTRDYDSDEFLADIDGNLVPFRLNRSDDTEIGLKIVGDFTLRRRVPLSFGQQTSTTAFAQLAYDIEEARNSDLDDVTLRLRFGLNIVEALTTYSPAVFVGRRYIAGEAYEDAVGLQFSFERRNVVGGSVFGFVSYSDLENDFSDNLDGSLTRASLGFRRSIGGRALIGASLLYEHKDVDFDLDHYKAYSLNLFGSIDVRNGFTLAPRLAVEFKNFEDPSPLFVDNPDEESIVAGLRVEKNDFFILDGFSPFLDVSFRRTETDINAFSYDETEVSLGLSRRF